MRFTRSLQVNRPWAAMILGGEKTVETSGQPCTRAGAAPGWVLLRDESGCAAGAARLGARFEYSTATAFREDFNRHRVPESDPFAFGRRQRTWGFPVLETMTFASPIPVPTPPGQSRLKTVEVPA